MNEELNYHIIGDSGQVLEISLEPAKTLIADGGALLYLDEEITFELRADDAAEDSNQTNESIFSEPDDDFDTDADGLFALPDDLNDELTFESSEEKDEQGSLLEKLWTATKKVVQNIGKKKDEEMLAIPKVKEEEIILPPELEFEPEPAPSKIEPQFSWYLTHFTNASEYIRKIAFTTSNSGIVVPINLSEATENEVIIQSGHFLCARKGTKLMKHADTDIAVNFSKDKFFKLDKIKGEGLAFISAEGHVIAKELENDAIRVNLFSLIAYETTLYLDIQHIQKLQSMNFEDEIPFATLSGVGRYWIQTANLQQLVQRVSPYIFEDTIPQNNSSEMPVFPNNFDDENRLLNINDSEEL